MDKHFYLAAADLILLVHILFVVFVVMGLILILTGGCRNWRWVRNRGFRITHLAAIAIVVLQSWFGMICPLTSWEMDLRARAGDAVYQGTFVSNWLQSLLYVDVPLHVLAVFYTAFGILVLASWFWFRPDSTDQTD